MNRIKKLKFFISLCILLLLLSSCQSGGNVNDFNAKIAGTWHLNGNLQDKQLNILSDGNWNTKELKDENWEITEEGSISYDKEYKMFRFQTENKFYPIEHSNDNGETIHFRNDNYYRADKSINGFAPFDGQWNCDGDNEKEYYEFENGEWKYFTPQGMAHVSVDSGNLAWNGSKGELVAYAYNDGEIFAKFVPADDGSLSKDGVKYIFSNNSNHKTSSKSENTGSSIITYEFYYMDGEIGQPSFFFYDDEQVDYDDGYGGTVKAIYNIEDGKVIIRVPDGVIVGSLTILDDSLLMDDDGETFYAINND